MRIATWNMAYWSHRQSHDGAWRWLLEEIQPDVLLVQEAVVPDWVRQRFGTAGIHWARARDASRQPWGTGILTTYPLVPERIPSMDEWFSSLPATGSAKSIHRADGWLASARVTLPTVGEVLVNSMHSPSFPIERSRLSGIDISAMKLKKNPDLWFTDVVFHFLRPMLGARLLVGGDFNASRLLDVTLGERGNNEFFDRIQAEGFESLHRRFHPEDEQTFFAPEKGKHQLDYLYADQPVAKFVEVCRVHPPTEFSDHAPVLADFAIA